MVETTKRGRGRPKVPAEQRRLTGTVRAMNGTKERLLAVCAATGEKSADVLERLLRKPLATELAKLAGAKS